MTQRTNTKPIDTIRDGALKASIWANQPKAEDKAPFYSVRITRTYTDEQGNYHDSDSFSGSELLRVARLADRSYGRTSELRAEATTSQQNAA
ncbi:MAG: hypothetical protein HRU13_13265 [Phycisphaerales bacterium]|nr:hypothetical protein [Phycisphaerales bacterium]